MTVLVTLALLASACGDDGDGETTAPTDAPAEATTTTADTATTATTTTAGVPTASFRGVTADVIRVGLLSYDWDRLAALGVEFGVSNTDDLLRAAFEAINDRGGINGRMLELYPVSFLPVGSDEADAACVELTDDDEVFLVVGTALNDQILCFTQLNQTAAIVVNGMNDRRRDLAEAPYATLLASQEVRNADAVAVFEETGVLDGATIGVTGSMDVSQTNFEAAVAALRDAGHDPVEALIGGNADDLAQTARDQALVYQRMEEAGVDVTISTTGVPLEMSNAIEAGYRSDQWLMTTTMTGRGLREAGVPWDYLDGALGVANTLIGTADQPTLADDPDVSACIDDLVARTGHEVFYELDVEINDIQAAIVSCGLARIVEAALTNAGTDLTNDSLQAGIEAIGEIELPGYFDVRFAPDQMGGARGLRLVEFDAAAGAWNVVG